MTKRIWISHDYREDAPPPPKRNTWHLFDRFMKEYYGTMEATTDEIRAWRLEGFAGRCAFLFSLPHHREGDHPDWMYTALKKSNVVLAPGYLLKRFDARHTFKECLTSLMKSEASSLPGTTDPEQAG